MRCATTSDTRWALAGFEIVTIVTLAVLLWFGPKTTAAVSSATPRKLQIPPEQPRI